MQPDPCLLNPSKKEPRLTSETKGGGNFIRTVIFLDQKNSLFNRDRSRFCGIGKYLSRSGGGII